MRKTRQAQKKSIILYIFEVEKEKELQDDKISHNSHPKPYKPDLWNGSGISQLLRFAQPHAREEFMDKAAYQPKQVSHTNDNIKQ